MVLLRPKPIDRWLGLAGVAVGVFLYLLPKTPTIVVSLLILIFLVLFHPLWNFWWIEKHLWSRVVALLLMMVGLVAVGKIAWPSPSPESGGKESDGQSAVNRTIPTMNTGGPSVSPPPPEPSERSAQNGSKNKLASISASILVVADVGCEISIDGKVVGDIAAEKSIATPVRMGDHLIAATASNSLVRWETHVKVEGPGQVVVETALQGELLKTIAGTWSWNNFHKTEGLRPYNVDDAWQVSVSPNEVLLTNAHVELSRTVGKYLPSEASDYCEGEGCYKCIWDYDLMFQRPYNLGSLAFTATREIPKKYQTFRGDSKSSCEQIMPNVGFSGSLVFLGQSQLQLQLNKPAVNQILTRE